MFIFIIPEKSIPEPKQDHYRIRNTFWIIKALQKLENWVLTPPDYDAPLKPDRRRRRRRRRRRMRRMSTKKGS